jgi:hypothetical protein
LLPPSLEELFELDGVDEGPESDFAELDDSDFESLDVDFAAGSEGVVDGDLPLERLSVL